jgi:type IV secretory pathway VirB2 component (pilin)
MNLFQSSLIANKAKLRIAQRQRQIAAWGTALSLGLLSSGAHAQAATFTRFETILAAFQAFMVGPFGRAAVVISIIAAFVTWVFAPKEGIFGPVLRVVVAGVAIINAVALMGTFTA